MSGLQLQDLAPPKSRFLHDVLKGLHRSPRTLPCKYFYDERGSRLFDEICRLPEYYPTRAELAIMRAHAAGMAGRVGKRVTLVEYGSGSSLKTHLLLAHLADSAVYVPVDISREHLRNTAEGVNRRYPPLTVRPVCADFTRPFELPEIERAPRTTVVYFPGSTIGNFSPPQAAKLLKGVADLVGPQGGLLIGVDLRKSRTILEAAYNDARGVTARFNLNLLVRINRELGADFDLDAFEHRAFYDDAEGRVEMHLVSRAEQTVTIEDESFEFAPGETIHTENSYKYTLSGFADLASRAGFTVADVWTDPLELFSVQYLVPGR